MYRFQSAARSDEAQLFSEQALSRLAGQFASPANPDISACQLRSNACASRRADCSLPWGHVPCSASQPSARRPQYNSGTRTGPFSNSSGCSWQGDSSTSTILYDQRTGLPVELSGSNQQPSSLAPEWQSPTGNRTVIRQQSTEQQQRCQQHTHVPAYPMPPSTTGWQSSLCPDDGKGTLQAELALLESQFQAASCESSPTSAQLQFQCYPKAVKVEQSIDAAAVVASWQGPCSLPSSPSSGNIFEGSFGSQASGCSDACPEDDRDVHNKLPVLSPKSSTPRKSDANAKNEADSTADHPTKFSGRKKTRIDHITVEYLRKNNCFDMPLAEAAKSLDLGLSVMKRVCRTLGLTRWPYRTRASLRSVIEKTDKYLADQNAGRDEGEACFGQKAHVLEALQSHMDAVTGQGGSDLNAAIKKYRQSIFKLNYKLKKSRMNCKARHRIAVPQNAAERILADQVPDMDLDSS